MKSDKNIDFQNDWKLITLFIGGNDLCRFCNDLNKYSPENYISEIRNGLDLLYSQVPRAFVNLVQVKNLRIFFWIIKNTIWFKKKTGAQRRPRKRPKSWAHLFSFAQIWVQVFGFPDRQPDRGFGRVFERIPAVDPVFGELWKVRSTRRLHCCCSALFWRLCDPTFAEWSNRLLVFGPRLFSLFSKRTW
jgi:hypothetical protein